MSDRPLQCASLREAEEEVAWLALVKERVSGAAWTWAHTLAHCAQRMGYAMAGFALQKFTVFPRALGALAMSAFAWRGRMTRDLVDPIPGAPVLQAQADSVEALARLHRAIDHFQHWSEPLKPHFVDGEHDKEANELAHDRHLVDHLSLGVQRQGMGGAPGCRSSRCHQSPVPIRAGTP